MGKIGQAVMGWGIVFLLASHAPGDAAGTARPDSQSAGPDAELRRRVVGTWEDEYQGKRTMTLKENGTGTMRVELEGLRAALFARQLQFEMEWSVEQGRLKKRTLRGTPAVQVQAILRAMGDRVEQRILELSEDRLLLLDEDGKTRYDWQRLKPKQPPDSTARPPACSAARR
jgi:hypothetical protein